MRTAFAPTYHPTSRSDADPRSAPEPPHAAPTLPRFVRHALESLLAGRTLAGRYRIEERIGAGGMSVVFRGFDETLNRPVALKVVGLDAADGAALADLRARFRREAAAAGQLSRHPHIVQVHDFGTDEALALDFIVMELLEGRDLKAALAAGELFPLEMVLRVLHQAAAALAAGHAAGIVHRDVKPANLFLTGPADAPDVRVLDFGIAKALTGDDELTRTGGAPHSPAYASPEQLRGEATITPASDVYQLGLIALEMLTDARPRFGTRGWDGDEAALEPEAAARWRAVPPPLRVVIAQALRPAPAERFADAAQFARALEAADAGAEEWTVLHHGVASDTTGTAPSPRAPPTQGAASRSGAGLALHAQRGWWLAAAALLVLIVVLLWSRRERAAPVVASAAADTLARRDAEFLRLQAIAAQRLAERDLAVRAGTSSDFDGAREQARVQRTVAAVQRSLANGDAEEAAAPYADPTDYRGAGLLPRDTLRAAFAREIEAYRRRRITIRRQAITFPSDTTARALVDREWEYETARERWTGADRLDLRLAKRDGAWRITAERQPALYRSTRAPL